jgi:hypothetical protein
VKEYLTMKTRLLPIVLLILIANNVVSQTFIGIGKSFVDQKFNDYKVQQFLMSEVYKISSTTPVYFEYDHILRDYDKDDGDFLVMLSSYRMNDSTGLVLTSFVGGHQMGIEMTSYYTLHLSDKEFNSINESVNLALSHLVTLRNSGYQNDASHYLLTVNEKIMVDAIYDYTGVYHVVLWINGTNRHSFPMTKWKDAYSKHKKFTAFKN